MTTKLGVRQREVLTHMARNGGMWPVEWRNQYARQPVFDSLLARGLIVRTGKLYRTVTPR